MPARFHVRSGKAHGGRRHRFVFWLRPDGILAPHQAGVVDDAELWILWCDGDAFGGREEGLIGLSSGGFPINRRRGRRIERDDVFMLIAHEGVKIPRVKGHDLVFERGAQALDLIALCG